MLSPPVKFRSNWCSEFFCRRSLFFLCFLLISVEWLVLVFWLELNLHVFIDKELILKYLYARVVQVQSEAGRCRFAGLQVYRFAGLQVCRFAGLQVYRFAGFQVCRFARSRPDTIFLFHLLYQITFTSPLFYGEHFFRIVVPYCDLPKEHWVW